MAKLKTTTRKPTPNARRHRWDGNHRCVRCKMRYTTKRIRSRVRTRWGLWRHVSVYSMGKNVVAVDPKVSPPCAPADADKPAKPTPKGAKSPKPEAKVKAKGVKTRKAA